jgi:hypothetical protein
MPRIQLVYLVIRSDGEVRVAKRPRLGSDEVAVAIRLTFPDGWGQIAQTLDIHMPEPPTADAQDPVPEAAP